MLGMATTLGRVMLAIACALGLVHTTLMPPPQQCKMQVRTFEWGTGMRCIPLQEECENCAVPGFCEFSDADMGGNVHIYSCKCVNAAGVGVESDCFTMLTVDLDTFEESVTCGNLCCDPPKGCKSPAPGTVWTSWTDACPCT